MWTVDTLILFPRELWRVGNRVPWRVPGCRRMFGLRCFRFVDSRLEFSVLKYGSGVIRRG